MISDFGQFMHRSFSGTVACYEREMAFDEGVSASISVPGFQFASYSNIVVKEGEECVRRASDEVEASDGQAEEASEGASFVEIMGSLEKEAGG